MKRLLLLVVGWALLTGVAYAHGGSEHVMGTVTSVVDQQFTVRDLSGVIRSFSVDPGTKFFRGDDAAGLQDIKTGTRVVVHFSRRGGQMMAEEVKIGVAKSPHAIGMQCTQARSVSP